ncbi:phage tail protein [Bacillus thuringiensis serovar shandongiensis]|uniref:major tail protein n=1 Tax=Bacillus toyonensis TaxID=155322 RepID=UPI000B440449|nr:major tail protein [Bacillus toyonensis]MEC2390225.1 phage tail protein [Bacillus toyonensis]OTX32073.1 phage tail protein [Bacillus thuringiensis serovar malayensis]OUB10817.1 phage tail protein [Bacillus thuringiensis serovar shandongiensis]
MIVDFRDLHYAVLTETPDGKFNYSTPKRIGKTVSGKASPKAETGTFYAEGGPSATASSYGGTEIELETDKLPLSVYAELLGKKVIKGQVVDNVNDVAPYVALLYRLPYDNRKNLYVCYYKMKFEIPSEEHKTAEDKPNFQSAKIKGKAIQRSDGNWRHRLDEEEIGYDATVASNWFKTVPSPPIVGGTGS